MREALGAPQALVATACFGAVCHHRHGDADHRFVYPLAYLRLPLSRLEALSVPLLGIDRPNVFSLRYRDHGSRDGTPPLVWVRGVLARHGLARVADGEIVLQTMPRLFGYVFNPVSFWFCHDRAGALRAVVAEVNNTFGERHQYLVHHPDRRPIQSGETLRVAKAFHVSPFFPVSGEYRFRFFAHGAVTVVSVDYWDEGAKRLSTRIGGRGEPLSGAAMARWLARFPFMTLGVVARIHWQALRLWCRRLPVFSKPAPPQEEMSR